MSIDNIQLSTVLLQQLYPKSLVELQDESEKKPSDTLSKTKINSLGNNEKNILIVVNENDAPFLNDGDFSSLVKILSAVQLSPADIALVNFNKNPATDFNQLNETFRPVFIVLLGVSPAELQFPLLFPDYQLTNYNGQTYLASPSLKQMTDDVETKRQFWTSFKKHLGK